MVEYMLLNLYFQDYNSHDDSEKRYITFSYIMPEKLRSD